MSLIMTAPESSYAPLPEGIYPAVCYMVADIGDQYSKKYDNWARKVVIGWEIDGEFKETEDGEKEPRTVHAFYKQSTHENSQIRKMLENWRNKKFTEEEVRAFDLTKIVGLGCQVQIRHYTKADGNISEEIAGVTMLPKGFPAPAAAHQIIFDMDAHLDQLEFMPKIVQTCVAKSRQMTEITPPDDNDQPFGPEDNGPFPE